jgi:hypothetical protein
MSGISINFQEEINHLSKIQSQMFKQLLHKQNTLLTFISGPISSLRVSLRWACVLTLLVPSTNKFDNIPGLATMGNCSSALAKRISRNTTFPVFMNKAAIKRNCHVYAGHILYIKKLDTSNLNTIPLHVLKLNASYN